MKTKKSNIKGSYRGSRSINFRATRRNSQRASRKQARESKYRRNPLNMLAEVAGQMPTHADPRGPFIPLPPPVNIPLPVPVPVVAQPIPDFIRYIPTMPDGHTNDATGAEVIPRDVDVLFPVLGNILPPPGPMPAGMPTYNASGSSKKVFFHPNSQVAYITSTHRQMAYTQDTNEHFREELILTQIENFLFPDILEAYQVGEENQHRIQSYKQTFPANIFIYKKRKVRQSQGDSIGIIHFILDSIRRFSYDRMGEPVPLCFTNLDIKPENIGILPDGRFIYLDNGSVFLYPIPHEFREYYERASLIIGLCNLQENFYREELELIRPRLSREQLYETFTRELRPEEKEYIRDYARQFFIAQGLPLTAENGIRFPQEMMRHYCKMENTHIRGRDDFMGRFREVTQNNRLDKL